MRGFQLNKAGVRGEESLLREPLMGSRTAPWEHPEPNQKALDSGREGTNVTGWYFIPPRGYPKQFATHWMILYVCSELYVAFH